MEARNAVFYCLTPQGQMFRHQVVETPIELTEEMLQPLTRSLKIKAHNLWLDSETKNVVNMVGSDNVRYYSLVLPHLILQAPFKVVEKFLVPQFDSAIDPVIPMKWEAPEGCILKYLVQCVSCVAQCEWLIAYDMKGVAWKLPLPNIYDDCRICSGDYERSQSTDKEAVEKSLEQFWKSKWNRDLWQGNVEKAQALFRFKSSNGNKFSVVKPEQNWTTYCAKIGTGLLEFIL